MNRQLARRGKEVLGKHKDATASRFQNLYVICVVVRVDSTRG